MKKVALFGALLICTSGTFAQSVFEKVVFKNNSSVQGDLVLRDDIIAKYNTNTDIVSTGHHLYNQDQSSAVYRVVLVSHDSTGSTNFAYEYAITGHGNPFNAFSYSVAQDTTGYIMTGQLTDNAYYGTTLPGGGDVLLLKTDNSGTVVARKRIDIGTGNDIGYSIKPTGYGTGTYLVCGSSTKSNGDVLPFLMEIDYNLNVNWFRELDLRISSGTSTLTEFFDVTTDGSNIWAVGKIQNTGSANKDGLVVKFNSSGNYQSSYRVYGSTINDREVFSHVEMDGSNLIISGYDQQGKLTPLKHMLALQYNTSSNSVTLAWLLKSGSSEDVGNHILTTSGGGTTSYFVVGEVFPSSGSSTGILYKLDGNFMPIRHQEYGGSGNSGIYAVDVYNTGSNGAYLGMSGYYSNLNGKLGGYVIKSDLNGYTGCNDSLSVDSVRITLSTASLLDSIDTTFTAYSPGSTADTLADSLLCSGTGNTRFTGPDSGGHSNVKKAIIYPNPVENGQTLGIYVKEGELIKEVVLCNSFGSEINRFLIDSESKNYSIPITNLSPGLYLLKVTEVDDDGRTNEVLHKIVVR